MEERREEEERSEVGKKGDRLGEMQNGKREGRMMVKKREKHEELVGMGEGSQSVRGGH